MNKKIKIGVIGVVIIFLVLVFGTQIFKNTETEKNLQQELVPAFEGPGGCQGTECNQYCNDNPKECDLWCEKNVELCKNLKEKWGQEPRKENEPDEKGFLEGDGVWEKAELTFYINDGEGILSNEKRKVIQDTVISEKKSGGGFWGWNLALEELNVIYPQNKVPDVLVEIDKEDADIIISVYSEKEYCCDYNGQPITGYERSQIDDDDRKIKSNVHIYNILEIDLGFLGDVTRHEIGHTLGIFSHVVDRNDDLMSLVSPSSVIKEGNLNDLYLKYRDRKIETNEEAREKDQKYN